MSAYATKECVSDSAEVMTRIAIVEDNATLRQYLSDLIAGTAGLRCVCACGSAEEALEKLPPLRPDVVLMDIHLPGESGIVCTARLCERMPDLQVIMLTVYKDTKMIFQALKAGACGYLLKRSDERELLQAIAEVRAGGAPMTSGIARMVVRSFREPLAGPDETNQLSGRESEILSLVAEGLSNKEIGLELGISPRTVEIHRTWVMTRMQAKSMADLVRMGLALGLA